MWDMGSLSAYQAAVAVLIAVWIWILLAAWTGEPRVRVIVEGGHFKAAPAWVRLRVMVERDAANRWLITEMDSGAFYRRSDEQLDGASAPRTRWVEWRDVPAGVYTVHALVERDGDRPARATAGFTVLDRVGEE